MPWRCMTRSPSRKSGCPDWTTLAMPPPRRGAPSGWLASSCGRMYGSTDISHMEFGQPSTGAPRAAIAAAHRVLDAEGLGYWESAPLKARIVQHYAETYGVAVEPRQITLTCGASPALVIALSATFRSGDV